MFNTSKHPCGFQFGDCDAMFRWVGCLAIQGQYQYRYYQWIYVLLLLYEAEFQSIASTYHRFTAVLSPNYKCGFTLLLYDEIILWGDWNEEEEKPPSLMYLFRSCLRPLPRALRNRIRCGRIFIADIIDCTNCAIM
jgi:hypothetical protein